MTRVDTDRWEGELRHGGVQGILRAPLQCSADVYKQQQLYLCWVDKVGRPTPVNLNSCGGFPKRRYNLLSRGIQ